MQPLILAVENAGNHIAIVGVILVILVVGFSGAWLLRAVRSRRDAAELSRNHEDRGGVG